MELSLLLIFKIVASLVATLLLIGLFAELSWLTKLRLTASLLTGIILIGILGWPLTKPADPFGAVSLAGHTISFSDAVSLAILAFFAGFIAYFLSWPQGREIAVLAVPAGLAVWAVRSGTMAGLMQLNSTLPQRQALFATLKWEPLFWLAVVAVGFCGVSVAQKISLQKPEPQPKQQKSNSRTNKYLTVAIALAASAFIAQLFIRILAQDVRVADRSLGSVIAQPAIGQVIFALLVSFGLAGFIVKKFLDVSYIWPMISSVFIAAFGIITYAKLEVLEHVMQRWPAVFFPNAVISILPVQMVAFGALGSIAGYWLAVRYNYWRKHEMTAR